MSVTTKITFNDSPSGQGDAPQVTGRISNMVITNNAGESIAYSTDSGDSFTTLANGSSATLGAGDPSSFRFRRVNSGGYPLAVDAVITMSMPMSDGWFDSNADGSTSLLGPSGEIVHSTPIILGAVQSGIPSSGVVGANGALTVSTAFLETYSDGCWLYFPAGAVYAGSLAGLYWVVMSSTTVGTIYNNLLTLPGTVNAPASPTPIVAAGPGAYTQTLAEIVVAAGTVPAGSLGSSGVLQIASLVRHNSSAGAKSWKANYGGTNFAIRSSTTTTLSNRVCSVYNSGSTSRQVSTRWVGPDTTVTTDPTFGTVDTTVDQVASVSVTLAADADWVVNLATLATVIHGD